MKQAFVALGSNLDSPASHIKSALAALNSIANTQLVRSSSLYRTAPVGYVDQPDFINAVAELQTSLQPLELLQALMEIEAHFGRVRTFRNAPRVLDLDLLVYEGEQSCTDELTIPHPRMHERAFVMVPLAEIAPTLHLNGHPASDHVLLMDGTGVEKLSV